MAARSSWPRVESNHRTQLRRLPLYPLSYGAGANQGIGPARRVPAGVDGRAGRMLQQLLRRVPAALRMDLLAEPLAQRAELALLQLLVEAAELVVRTLPQLHGHHRPEEVRREVADQARRPVHVLQHAVRMV